MKKSKLYQIFGKPWLPIQKVNLHVRRNTIEIEFEKELDEMKDSIVITKMSMDVCSDVKKCFQCVPWPQ